MSESALFTCNGDTYTPSELTRGPWSMDAQHAGPAAALMAGLIEEVDAERALAVVRITFELLRPIPLLPIRALAASVSAGRSTDRVRAEVRVADSDELIATALAVRVRRKPVEVPEPGDPPPAPPAELQPVDVTAWDHVTFVSHAMDLRLAAGAALMESGPATVWFRLRYPLVDGRQTTPLQRVCAAADSGNGISNVTSFAEMLYINPDLTVALTRQPEGEWICLDSVTRLSREGFGGTESHLFDECGRIGTALQSLLVSPR